ncbi:2-hydroxyacid dehydrogenase, partial [Rhizobium ruizarguesonis]
GKVRGRVRERLKDRVESIAVEREEKLALNSETAGRIRGVAVSGSFPGAWRDQRPHAEVIANFGVGDDGIDLKRAAEKGI